MVCAEIKEIHRNFCNKPVKSPSNDVYEYMEPAIGLHRS
jgi:hypothetical protein